MEGKVTGTSEPLMNSAEKIDEEMLRAGIASYFVFGHNKKRIMVHFKAETFAELLGMIEQAKICAVDHWNKETQKRIKSGDL